MDKLKRWLSLLLVSCISWLLIHQLSTPVALAHWADLAVADVTIDRTTAQIILTIPTGLVAGADDDRSGQLSPTEIQRHQDELRDQLKQKIQLRTSDYQVGNLVVLPVEAAKSLAAPSNSHSNLKLVYRWPRPVAGVKMRYSLFAPGISTARCLATVKTLSDPTATTASSNAVKNIIFSPENQEVTLLENGAIDWSKGLWVSLVGAFLWGAAHAASPGHGKTLVGAYLIGERATAQHAIFLGLTTTVTHTLGVFSLGAFMLVAANTVMPEKLLPWLSLVSGVLVVVIGGTLLRNAIFKIKSHGHDHGDHSHSDHDHHHDDDHSDHDHHHLEHHEHAHDHNHSHSHHHGGHSHSHLPPEDTSISWRSLFALGVSGGLVPCPSALVLLLSAIAIGQVAHGLLLVLAFSSGLAMVLTSLGLVLIYAKKLFVKLPTGQLLQVKWTAQAIPAVTALVIMLVGLGISYQALWQMQGNASII